MSIVIHHCTDVSDHARRLSGWQQEFDQIEEGSFSGEIVDVSGNGVRLLRERANLSLSQSMNFPDEQLHLVLPIHWPSDAVYDMASVTLLPQCEQFWSVAPCSYDVLVASINRHRYDWLSADAHKIRKLTVSIALLNDVRTQWRAMTDYLISREAEGADLAQYQRSFSREIRASTEMLLDETLRTPVIDDANYRTRRYIVERCRSLCQMHPDNPPTLMELCQSLKISRRTLQYSFQKETGQAPLHYLRALRLNAVRRSLLRNPEVQVADAAALQGFFHQSYFSREYRRLFKELPSVTRQRAL